MHGRLRLVASAAAVAATFVLLPLASAAGGDLDTAFGVSGKVVTDFGASEEAIAVALQRDGRILVGGSTGGDLLLARYHPDGALDASFGAGGRVLADLGGLDAAGDIALRPDGRFLVAAGGFMLARYRADGRLDRAFGTEGTVEREVVSGGRLARILLRSDGKIVAAGSAPPSRFVLARYGADGSLDPTFGRGGTVVTEAGGPSRHESSLRDAALTLGKIVAVGLLIDPHKRSSLDGRPIAIVVVRYEADGRLDRSFGGDGIVTLDLRPHDSSITSVGVQRDGRVVVGGHGHPDGRGAGGPALWRFRPDGSLDRTFGENGKAVSEGDGGLVTDLALDRFDRIVVVARGGKSLSDFAVARSTVNGALDRRFAAGGVVTTNFGGMDVPWTVALQPDGKVVAAGGTGPSLLTTGSRDVAVARYLTAG